MNYTISSKKVIIICKKHGPFSQIAGQHLMGKGCPKCSCSVSKKSQRWLDGLRKNIVREYNIEVDGNKYIADGFDPDNKTIYEFYGDFWHGNPDIYGNEDVNPANKRTFGELYQATIKREEILKNAGYDIISIWESDYNRY